MKLSTAETSKLAGLLEPALDVIEEQSDSEERGDNQNPRPDASEKASGALGGVDMSCAMRDTSIPDLVRTSRRRAARSGRKIAG